MAICFSLAIACCAHAHAGDAWQFTFTPTVAYGRVDGYVQTPRGGEPGTSSNHRPKFSEIGINDATIYRLDAVASRKSDQLYFDSRFIRLSGDDMLGQTLVSQGNTYPADSNVNSDVQLDWYAVGYRRQFTLGEQSEWTITPSIGAALWRFHYKLDSPGSDSVDRSYSKATVQLGVETEWRPDNGPFSLDLALLGSPPIKNFPQIFSESLLAKYRVYENPSFDVSLVGGVEYEQIFYEDHQTLSNRVRADFGPMIVGGVEIRF
jgi:hypothetical protein